MLHLGDITKISGYDVPIVDCVTFGAPCQDLSVAGKRQGMKHTDLGNDETTRSGLFHEAIRIIKEMREKDESNGRTGEFIRPRFAVYENVPGAFSSNKGQDFKIVLESLAKVIDKDASIPMPPKNKWANSGCIMGDGWSIAWRILDAQFWGVPQRRRRIALVADFGGECAPEILFVRKNLSGHTPKSRTERQTASSDAERSIGANDCEGRSYGFPLGFRPENVRCYDETATTLCVGTRAGFCNGVITLEPGIASRESGHIYENVSGTLRANAGDNQMSVAYSIENHPTDSRVNIDVVRMDEVVAPFQARDYKGGKLIAMATQQGGAEIRTDDKCPTLTAAAGMSGNNQPVICLQGNGIDRPAVVYNGENITSPLNKSNPQIGDACHTLGTDSRNYVVYKNPQYIVRRLTPLECERLQGFPDGWTDIGEYIDSNGKKKQSSNSARYKALGNSISIPNWKWVLKRLCSHYERDATLASLFDGIGGFPYIWEQINGNGTALWASEIEYFPMAVTKVRIGE